jgi:hypothetical protein
MDATLKIQAKNTPKPTVKPSPGGGSKWITQKSNSTN